MGGRVNANARVESSVVSVRMWDAGWGTGTPWGNGSDDAGELRTRPPLRAMLPLRIMATERGENPGSRAQRHVQG